MACGVMKIDELGHNNSISRASFAMSINKHTRMLQRLVVATTTATPAFQPGVLVACEMVRERCCEDSNHPFKRQER